MTVKQVLIIILKIKFKYSFSLSLLSSYSLRLLNLQQILINRDCLGTNKKILLGNNQQIQYDNILSHAIKYDYFNYIQISKAFKMQVGQDLFIQKKLLYKFDKKIQILFQSIFANSQNQRASSAGNMVDQSQQSDKKNKLLSKSAILQQIQQLKFQNFKYRTALISAKKDQTFNQQILKKSQQQISGSKQEVQDLSKQLQYSLKCKKNKQDYNQLAQSLKSTYEPLSVQNQKLQTISRQISQMQIKYEKERCDYDKKQKCLKLALSALKCVIQTQDNQTSSNDLLNGGMKTLYQNQPMINQSRINPTLNHTPLNNFDNYSGRQQGEQPQGGEILN